MSSENALAVYEKICSAFDERGWRYEKKEDDLSVRYDVSGEDIPMSFIFRVRENNDSVTLFTLLPFDVPEDKRMDMAIVICAINNRLVDGCFDFDVGRGAVLFRMNNSYMDCEPDSETFSYMIDCSASTVDRYNDKFLMLVKGYLTVEQFLAETQG